MDHCYHAHSTSHQLALTSWTCLQQNSGLLTNRALSHHKVIQEQSHAQKEEVPIH